MEASPLARSGGPRTALIVLARDVSRIVELRESLRRSERMSAMGQLVGGVAHQVRNPLFSISSTLAAFDAEFGARPELKEHSDSLREEIERLTSLMNDLLAYGKPPVFERVRAPLASAVERAVRACAPEARRRGVELVTSSAEDLPELEIDGRRLSEALQNLIENAIQHAPWGSSVRIWARRSPSGGEPAVECGVDDRGSGFAAADLPKLFDPFFSRRSGGTGLGLAIAQRIVDEHGGRLHAENVPGGGARVAMRLPATGGRLPAVPERGAR